MKTPTHLLAGYIFSRATRMTALDTRCFIAGACLPDLPIIVCWPALGVYTVITGGGFDISRFREIADRLYFSDSALAHLHNLLHSPVSLALLILLTGILFPDRPRLRRCLVVALVGAVTHSVIDIVSHVDDGPLVFWPVEQSIRVRGLFSHWNPAYGGGWVTIAELIGTCAAGVYLTGRRMILDRGVRRDT